MRIRLAHLCFSIIVLVIFVLGLKFVINSFFPTEQWSFNVKNVTYSEEFVIPNIVHYILFKKDLDFMAFLSIISVIKVQNPEKILIHCDCESLSGRYWSALKSFQIIELHYQSQPTHVYGQRLSSVYHATDVARIIVLMEWGGIYLDSDVLLIRSLDKFRHFDMVLGWPKGQYIGTQVLMANKDSQFLSLWLHGYKRYQPRAWYYNAGQYPTEQILQKHPGLAHTEPFAFGVHNLLGKLYGSNPWPEWHQLTAIHTLGRHYPAPQDMNETFVLDYSAPFGEIARWILYELQPKVIPLR